MNRNNVDGETPTQIAQRPYPSCLTYPYLVESCPTLVGTCLSLGPDLVGTSRFRLKPAQRWFESPKAWPSSPAARQLFSWAPGRGSHRNQQKRGRLTKLKDDEARSRPTSASGRTLGAITAGALLRPSARPESGGHRRSDAGVAGGARHGEVGRPSVDCEDGEVDRRALHRGHDRPAPVHREAGLRPGPPQPTGHWSGPAADATAGHLRGCRGVRPLGISTPAGLRTSSHSAALCPRPKQSHATDAPPGVAQVEAVRCQEVVTRSHQSRYLRRHPRVVRHMCACAQIHPRRWSDRSVPLRT